MTACPGDGKDRCRAARVGHGTSFGEVVSGARCRLHNTGTAQQYGHSTRGWRSERESHMEDMRVAFWNVQNLFDTTESDIAADFEFTEDNGWTPARLSEKLEALATVVNDMFDGRGPELLGLCEVENRAVLKLLVQRLRGKFRIAHVHSPDIRGIDTSLLYCSDRFEIAPNGDPADPSGGGVRAHLVHLRYPTRDIFEVPLVVRETGAELVVLVNHWPSRWRGRYKTEPFRIAVANHCAHAVQRYLKMPRGEFLALPDTGESLAQLNWRWNRNILVMGDLNDEPGDRSVVQELRASSGCDKIEEPVKEAREGRSHLPLAKKYLELQPTLFNCMGRFLGKPDEGTCFYSKGVNTMNILDQFIVSRGLLCGEAGLKARLESVSIFRHERTTTGKKRRPRRFEFPSKKPTKPARGASDHFPVTMLIAEAPRSCSAQAK